MTFSRRASVRAGAVAATAVVAVFALPLGAAAHVTIAPDGPASAGAWSTLTLKVPHHPDTGGTVVVSVDLPADAPMSSVSAESVAGWTSELITTPLDPPVDVGDVTLDEAVTRVTWTADPGVSIAPGEFATFGLSVGPLPEAGTYDFPAFQTYADGTVEPWDMPSEDDEASNPAPSVTVVEATGDADDHGAAGTAAHDDTSAGDTEGTVDASSSDGLTRGLAIGGVLVGAAGLGFGAAALRRSRA